ncbi:polysaccharide deacetylase [Marivirga lumbricoides]|uniref:Polysaccharide deacetylase n=1 Tax=Marivirga lumbricoides TaxID=1046115 RepID=A0ABQ1MGK1_9BACT|nr:polysaccharide deacetylase [Marivirga lumbricoides]
MRIFVIFLLLATFLLNTISAQTNVAITIDDVPNVRQYQKDKLHPLLLHKLDSLNVPIAIFINYSKLEQNKEIDKNKQLLSAWLQREYVTAANHTFSHSRYSDVGFESFKKDIEKGEAFREGTELKKDPKYFRFPFNDLGKDSLQHKKIKTYLKEQGFTIAPHTVESSDWMFSYLYEHYLKSGEMDKAKEVAAAYVVKTIQYFDFFDSLAETQYNRKINQIYLCHDNQLNADYLPGIIQLLKEKNYSFISLEEALKDPIYHQEDNYYQKWGVSWLYRWMKNPKERSVAMKQEPDIMEYYKVYEKLVNE